MRKNKGTFVRQTFPFPSESIFIEMRYMFGFLHTNLDNNIKTIVTVTFVHATFILVTSVTPPDDIRIDCILGAAHRILTVTVTFVQATFFLVTFVHIRSISALTDPILMKL